MSIVIIGDSFSFPEGDAATNRVHTYAKGFTENGKTVHVICFENRYDLADEGIINGIFYYHPFGLRKRSKYFFIRNWFKVQKYFKAVSLLIKINKQDKIDFITVYTMQLVNHLFAWVLAKITNSKLIKECGEHPLRLYQNGTILKARGLIKLYLESRLCDGIFCISRYLVEFYLQNGIPEHKLFLVTSTVDPDRFIQKGRSPLPFKYIGYFGGLTFKRDNIDVLIRSFARISNENKSIHLVIGGFCTEGERIKIENLIKDLNIAPKVLLLKYLPRQEIIRYIVHAHILVMVRGKDIESLASFPSKLTEYLATSKPVVTVNVGEITDYLIDGLNAFLVEPEDYVELAEKLNYVINNYDLALETAKRGRSLADTDFNYNYQAKRIIQYINEL